MTSLKALGALVALNPAVHAGVPYLPQIGPPPLRVAVVKNPALATIKFTGTAAVPGTNAAAISDAKTSSAGTNVANLTTPIGPAGPQATSPFVIETPDQTLGDSFAASVFSLPTPDLLGISPQILATYFRPLQTGTNFCAPSGAFPVIFIPPLPPLLPSMVPDTSSHAEYIVK
ncbi:MAG TPA: hypothetical protein VH251_03045 [Verrucomicrobiae bacterium]|jgi:hypothetical protein|nr:hypothetical protein [Verrucomicrobiae bacterium]